MRAISETEIGRMLHRFGGDRHALARYTSIAKGIAYAANTDPLFPDVDVGAHATACLLVADAWHASKLQPYLRRGPFLGLYQIRPPVSPIVTARQLLDPTSASLIAVDLMRQSVQRTNDQAWERRFAWYRALGSADGSADLTVPGRYAVQRSAEIGRTARRLFLERWETWRTPSFEDGTATPDLPPLLLASGSS